MKCLDLTLPTPSENLALDEALLDWCERGLQEPILRFWEPSGHFVVLGYANRVDQEVQTDVLNDPRWAIYRRCTGGGSVVQGPGCLNYSLILRSEEHGPLGGIASANQFIMEKHREALQRLLNENRAGADPTNPRGLSALRVSVEGHTDLVVNGLKCAGNAQRRGRHWLLFHGSFLLNADLAQIERALRLPSRQPSYRQGRSHREFLTNLGLPAKSLKTALRREWDALESMERWPRDAVRSLVRDKYATMEWNFKF